MPTKEAAKTIKVDEKKDDKTTSCGLIMPISALDGCSAEHWSEVKSIICEAIESIEITKFSVRLVSDADDVGIIQKRIVQNVYSSDIVVCDVSGKNPNVMFELGMRLAFDKPVVIIKDDKTDYSFDTGIIEHITYPRDLRFTRIVEFKTLLAAKVLATYESSVKNPDESPFLKNFGRFKVAGLDETMVSPDRLLIEMVEEIRYEIRRLQRKIDISERSPGRSSAAIRKYEFITRAEPVISHYLEKHNITNPSNLIGDEDFYSFMEKELGAPDYFGSKTDFITALNISLRQFAVG